MHNITICGYYHWTTEYIDKNFEFMISTTYIFILKIINICIYLPEVVVSQCGQMSCQQST